LKTRIGIVLGSGLHSFSDEIVSPGKIYEDSDSFHSIQVLKGKISNNEVVIFSGRRHYYEGYENDDIFQNINFAKDLGINLLILTNAAGGINRRFRVSDIMLITSHYNFIKNRFTENVLTDYYDKTLNARIKNTALRNKMILRTGSYCCLSGPMYETKSEIRYLAKYGIDAVGMSTVPEMIHAGNSGIKIIALSCITNLLSENSTGITDHKEVVEAGKNSYQTFSSLIKNIVSDFSDKF